MADDLDPPAFSLLGIPRLGSKRAEVGNRHLPRRVTPVTCRTPFMYVHPWTYGICNSGLFSIVYFVQSNYGVYMARIELPLGH